MRRKNGGEERDRGVMRDGGEERSRIDDSGDGRGEVGY